MNPTDRSDEIRARQLHGEAHKWTTTYPPEMQGWAEFVAHAPTDIRYLLDEIDRLRALELEREKNLQRITELGQEIDNG